MAKNIFHSVAFVAGMLSGVLSLGAQTNELTCFIYDPDYIFDPAKKTLSVFGTVYYLKK